MAVSSLVVQSAGSSAGYGSRAAQSVASVAQAGDKVVLDSDILPVQRSPNTGQVPTKLTPAQVNAALQEFQQAVQKIAPGLEFSIDEDLGVTVVKLMDRQTQQLVGQFPSEEMLNISKSIGRMRGLLVSKVA
jgi:flagellar protein FlaG